MKKRIFSLLLAILMVASMIPANTFAEGNGETIPNTTGSSIETTGSSTETTGSSTETTGSSTETTGSSTETTGASTETTGSSTETTGTAAETTVPETTAPVVTVCENCGTSPCTCTVTTDICLIGYLKQEGNISFFNNNAEENSLAVSECPKFLILTQKIVEKELVEDAKGNTQLVETVIYKTDSTNDDFYFNVIASAPFTEAESFSAVVPAAGLYTTLGSNSVTLYKELSNAGDTKTVALTGEYVVADFVYDATLFNWFVKLTPGENWPAEAEGYVWTYASSMATLTQKPTQQPQNKCSICGEADCTKIHFWCDRCEAYDCGKTHLRCLACGEVDCTKTHTFCGYCNGYDCGIDHSDVNKPVSKPVIPANPTLTPGADVSLVDEDGNSLADGLSLIAGTKTSISAWPNAGGDASYQWQICVDGRWINIQGQTDKGLLISPAMVLSAMDGGKAQVRCAITVAGETKTSDPIDVTVGDRPVMAAFKLTSRKGASGAMTTAEEGTDQKYTIIIKYVLHGEEISSSWGAEISPKLPLTQTVPMPTVLGYVPTVTNLPAGVTAVENENNALTHLHLEFGPNTTPITGPIVITVDYQPTLVDYRVKHYVQNATDDNYSLVLDETLRGYTEDQVDSVHKTEGIFGGVNFAGVYSLTYEKPVIAADGSTVVEIYYDRSYYLMAFDLDGGYGIEPVYARYGAPIAVQGEPTKAGHLFRYWSPVIDGFCSERPSIIPSVMPVGNEVYKAIWMTEADAKVSIVIWGENPNDTDYSYMETLTVNAKPGVTVDFLTQGRICGYTEEHNHDTCLLDCTREAHIHSIEECYRLVCDGQPDHSHEASGCTVICGIEAGHTHGVTCYTNVGDEANDPYDAPSNPQQGQIYSYWFLGTYSYIFIGSSWYEYNGTLTNGTIAPSTCEKVADHTHGDSCYGCGVPSGTHVHNLVQNCYRLNCDKQVHQHNDACYACGLSAHTHSSSCSIPTPTTIQAGLWTLNTDKTKPVTVAADGTAVLNVYYDRTEFTLTFVKSSSTVKTITKKWGADIHSEFPIKNSSNQTMWWTVPSGCESMNPGTEFGSLDTMPAENITFNYDDAESGKTLHYYVEALPNDDDAKTAVEIYNGFTTDNYTNIDGTKKYISYKDIDLTSNSSTYLTYTEEFHNITGFRQYVSYPKFNKHELGGITSSNLPTNCYLMYARNTFDIVFYNPTDLLKTEESVPYQMPLNSYDWTPSADQAPASYAPGSVQFGGWYLNPECSGEPFDFTTHTMPAGPNNEDGEVALALYAKWELVTHTVNFYPTEDDQIAGTNLYDTEQALHGTKMENPPADPTRGAYKFEGWFYRDANGEQHAFKPTLMVVNKDLNLYARWTSNTIVTYTIDYKVVQTDASGKPMKDADGNWIFASTDSGIIAPTVTGMAMAGTSKTFDAVLPTNATEKEGVFPLVSSHNLTFSAEDESKNQYTFPYIRAEKVPYTVRYVQILADGTEIEVAKTEAKESSYAVVTENYKSVPGLFPDAFQKSLILTVNEDGLPNTEGNVITFYYSDKPIYVVRHYVEKVEKGMTSWEIAEESIIDGEVGETYSAKPIEITGYNFSLEYTQKWNNAGKFPGEYSTLEPNNSGDAQPLPTAVTVSDSGEVRGQLTENGMYLNLYYRVGSYPYIIYFQEKNSGEALRTPMEGTAIFGKWIQENVTISGFTLTNPNEGMTIKVAENKEDNRLVYYYTRDTGNLKISKTVRAVTDDDQTAGSLAPNDTEFQFTVTPKGNAIIPGTSQFTIYNYRVFNKDNAETPVTSGTLYLNADGSLGPVSVKANQYVVIEGLPTGPYTVQETQILGYASAAYNGVDVTIESGATAEVAVENKYPVYTGDLVIRKEVKQVYEKDVLPNDSFQFMLTLTPDSNAMFVDRPYAYTIYDANNQAVKSETGTVTTSETTEEIIFSLAAGQYIRFTGLVVGTYKVTETADDDYTTEYVVYAANGAQMYSGTGHTIIETPEIVADKEVSVTFTNTYTRHRGNLKVIKTVVEEYEDDVWTDSIFTFTLSDKTSLQAGNYTILVDGVEKVIELDSSGEYNFGISIRVEDDPNSLTQSAEIVFVDLPVSNFYVEVLENTTSYTWEQDGESQTFDYEIQVSPQLNGTTGYVKITGDDTVKEITFTNTFPRTTGILQITKTVVPFNENVTINENDKFEFVVELVGGEKLSGSYAGTITGTGTPVTTAFPANSDGRLHIVLCHGQTVTLNGLPIGKYKITEIAASGYQSSFDHSFATPNTVKENVIITTDAVTAVECRNTYPIYFGELVVSKNVVTPDGYLPADRAPSNASFTYTLTMTNVDPNADLTNGIQAVFNNGATEYLTVGNNTITFNLKHGDTVALKLPVCEYTITEAAEVQLDYDVTHVITEGKQVLTGGISGSYNMTAGATQKLVYTNTWKQHLGQLTIHKVVKNAPANEEQVFLFHISGNGVEMDVTIQGDGEVTVFNLPLGTYTVTEDSSWSWRYSSNQTSDTATLTVEDSNGEVTFTNAFKEDGNKWLNFFTEMLNTFIAPSNDD